MSVKDLFRKSQDYAAEHEAPDLEKLLGNFGNPTWRDHVAYYKKAIANGVTFISSSNLLVFLPDNLKWIGGVVALVGWLVGVQVANGPKPAVKDKTAWAAAAAPPSSDAVMPTEDVITESPAETPPAMSALDADAQLAVEDRDEASTAPDA